MSDDKTLAEVLDMAKGQRIAMLTTVEDDQLVSRPMALVQVDQDNVLWLVTRASTDKADQVREDSRVNLAFASDDYVSVSGTAELVRDAAKAEELWNPHIEAWLQCEPSDPQVGLVRVTPKTAAWWTTPGAPRYLAGLAKAVLGDKRPSGGDHGIAEA